jgi:hypothetical protein
MPIPDHQCWRNGGVECHRCDLEQMAAEADGTLVCASSRHRDEVHAEPGTDRCADCLADAISDQASQAIS